MHTVSKVPVLLAFVVLAAILLCSCAAAPREPIIKVQEVDKAVAMSCVPASGFPDRPGNMRDGEQPASRGAGERLMETKIADWQDWGDVVWPILIGCKATPKMETK